MIQEKTLILSFKNIRATDLALVGGKGANLGELAHAGFPIPPGFCLTTTAFQQFVESHPDISRLYTLLDTVRCDDVETARKVGHEVRQKLLEIPMPQHIADAVQQEWQALGSDHAYAVRSSATAEDLPDASFAGQQDTYLNVIGESELLDAIHRCWVSLFTDRAILYCCQNNFSHQEVQLSVVVQQMVMSEMSGILFTADPLTGHRHTATIDASFGLGEALVSGIVSPDNYRVDTLNQKILNREIADKQIAIFPEKDGGTRQETLSDIQRSQTVLTDEQILDLADLGSRVQAHYHAPQDIEWAIADNQIYLLQARPITSLYPIDALQSPDDTLQIFFSMGHQQNMTKVMSHLGTSVMQCAVPIGQTPDVVGSPHIHVSGGRLFANITPVLRHPIIKRGFFAIISQFDALAPKTLRLAMQRPEFQAPHGISLPFSVIKAMLSLLSRIMKALWWQDLTGIANRVNDIIAQHVQDVRQEINQAKDGKSQIRAIIHILHSLFPVIFKWVPYFVAGEISKRLITRIGNRWADEIDFDAISLGLSGNVVTDMNMQVGDLADIARESAQLRILFENLGDDSQAALAQASQIEDSTAFMEAWDSFINQYGARGSSEIDIAALHWYEEPLPLLQVIASYLQKEKGSHRIQHQNLVDEREKAVESLRSKSKQGLFGWFRSRIVKRLLHVIYESSVLREHHKFMAVQLFAIIKEAIKQRAIELTESKKLAQADDIWYLSLSEILAIYEGENIDAISLAATRREQLRRYQKMTPPLVITSDGETPIAKYEIADAPEGALLGSPVSSGIVEGIVRVIHDPQTETLMPGEILVAPFTDPGWTPLFINAGGLILEVGGIMTHGSVVAREYGIPAVVGVRDATKNLCTGQKVRIDGNRGIIEIL